MEDERKIQQLWQAEIANTTPLGQQEPHEQTATHASEPYYLPYYSDAPTATHNEILLYQQSPLPKKLLQQLQAGKLTFYRRYDFHHHTTLMLHNQLNHILNSTATNDHRCLLMIHGKGQPHQPAVLKGYISYYLEQHPYCRAYCSTQAKDGGTGSIYVLI